MKSHKQKATEVSDLTEQVFCITVFRHGELQDDPL